VDYAGDAVVTILHLDGDIELIWTPETHTIKLSYRGVTLSRKLTEHERRKLSKALWYS
jgi:hypothetical protein